jgi:hypothetical protein
MTVAYGPTALCPSTLPGRHHGPTAPDPIRRTVTAETQGLTR